eukprot:scaffold195045_cov37-Attheya_sp.AAC.2
MQQKQGITHDNNQPRRWRKYGSVCNLSRQVHAKNDDAAAVATERGDLPTLASRNISCNSVPTRGCVAHSTVALAIVGMTALSANMPSLYVLYDGNHGDSFWWHSFDLSGGAE